MSRRKDRERYQTRKLADPNYLGFRGYGEESDQPDDSILETLKCTICGRKRNVPAGTSEAAGDSYICVSCQENDSNDRPTATTDVPKPRKKKRTKAEVPQSN